jgi:hypothetical protein
LENQEEWRNEEKAKEENRTSKEVQQEQEISRMCSTMCVQHFLQLFFYHKYSKTESHLNMIDLLALDENVLIVYNYRQEL